MVMHARKNHGYYEKPQGHNYQNQKYNNSKGNYSNGERFNNYDRRISPNGKRSRSSSSDEKLTGSPSPVRPSSRSFNNKAYYQDRSRANRYQPRERPYFNNNGRDRYRDRSLSPKYRRPFRDFRETNHDRNQDVRRRIVRYRKRLQQSRNYRSSSMGPENRKSPRSDYQQDREGTPRLGDWAEYTTKDGTKYYHNHKLNKSQWDKPEAWLTHEIECVIERAPSPDCSKITAANNSICNQRIKDHYRACSSSKGKKRRRRSKEKNERKIRISSSSVTLEEEDEEEEGEVKKKRKGRSSSNSSGSSSSAAAPPGRRESSSQFCSRKGGESSDSSSSSSSLSSVVAAAASSRKSSPSVRYGRWENDDDDEPRRSPFFCEPRDAGKVEGSKRQWRRRRWKRERKEERTRFSPARRMEESVSPLGTPAGPGPPVLVPYGLADSDLSELESEDQTVPLEQQPSCCSLEGSSAGKTVWNAMGDRKCRATSRTSSSLDKGGDTARKRSKIKMAANSSSSEEAEVEEEEWRECRPKRRKWKGDDTTDEESLNDSPSSPGVRKESRWKRSRNSGRRRSRSRRREDDRRWREKGWSCSARHRAAARERPETSSPKFENIPQRALFQENDKKKDETTMMKVDDKDDDRASVIVAPVEKVKNNKINASKRSREEDERDRKLWMELARGKEEEDDENYVDSFGADDDDDDYYDSDRSSYQTRCKRRRLFADRPETPDLLEKSTLATTTALENGLDSGDRTVVGGEQEEEEESDCMESPRKLEEDDEDLAGSEGDPYSPTDSIKDSPPKGTFPKSDDDEDEDVEEEVAVAEEVRVKEEQEEEGERERQEEEEGERQEEEGGERQEEEEDEKATEVIAWNEVKCEVKDEVKDEPMGEVKDEPMGEVKDEPMDEVKDEPMDEVKDEPMDEPMDEVEEGEEVIEARYERTADLNEGSSSFSVAGGNLSNEESDRAEEREEQLEQMAAEFDFEDWKKYMYKFAGAEVRAAKYCKNAKAVFEYFQDGDDLSSSSPPRVNTQNEESLEESFMKMLDISNKKAEDVMQWYTEEMATLLLDDHREHEVEESEKRYYGDDVSKAIECNANLKIARSRVRCNEIKCDFLEQKIALLHSEQKSFEELKCRSVYNCDDDEC